MKRTTIKDIAKALGISYVTVSAALTGKGRVSEETKNRIIKTAGEMDYYPNLAGRSLRSKQKTGVIAVVGRFFSNLFTKEFLLGMDMSMVHKREYYRVMQYTTRGSQERLEQVLKEILYSRPADAVILLTEKPEKEVILREFIKEKIPVICVEEEVKGLHNIKFDNHAGGYLGTEYLINSGRKKIAVISGRLESGGHTNQVPGERLQGYKDALKKHGIKFDKNLVAESLTYKASEAAEIYRLLLMGRRDIDAVFCTAGDETAISVLREAKKNGTKIPGELAVMGFDDLFFSDLVEPPLTTIKQDIYALGGQAFDTALRYIQESAEYEPCTIINKPQLIVRKSA